MSRVLILSWEYPPLIEGGLARHVRKLSEALVDLGAGIGEVLRELAHVPGETALDQGRVLPGEDQDCVQGSSSGVSLRSGARFRSRGSGSAAECMASSSDRA